MSERVRSRLLVMAGVAGVAILLLAFAPWVNFTSITDERTADFEQVPETTIDLRGTETSRFRDIETINPTTIQDDDGWCSCRVDVGDGYFVALAGAITVVAAALAFITRRDTLFGSLIAVAGLGSMFLAGFNAFGDWNAIAWTTFRQTEPVEGSTTPMLWGLVVVSAMAAVSGAVLWAAATGAREEDDYELDEEHEEEAPERLDTWA